MVYRSIIKPFFDYGFSVFLMLILSPLFLFLILILLIVNRGKPFFFQERPGRNGKVFKLVKFRTMVDKMDSHGELLPDNQRMTKFGKMIRAASLDELPQLINILSGDMSFVGPRPLLTKYLSLYTLQQSRRHEVKPGITGWAQVNGRNAITWTEKFRLDVWYIDNISFWLDVRIFLKTILKVLTSEGINSTESHTMEEYNGNN